jgi:type IV secretion system protein VirB1
MRYTLRILPTLALLGSTTAFAQANRHLSGPELRSLARQCVRKVHPDTIEAVARQESALYIYSLSINYPRTEAKKFGYSHAEYQIARQPHSLREAIAWMRWFLDHGHSVSIGLMQVSSEQARQLGLKDPAALFDPCLNLAAGAVVLQDSYRGQSPTLEGLARTFALYNAGSLTLGTEDGYAASVIAKAPPLEPRHADSPHQQR